MLIAVPLGAIAYVGSFTRLLADDYCTASLAANIGFWEAQKYWYVEWTGRFAFTFFTTLASLLGVRLASLLPAMAIIFWFATLTWLWSSVVAVLQGRRNLPFAAVLSGLTLLATLKVSPNLIQSFYWQNGFFNYGAPLIIWTVIAALLMAHHREPPRSAVTRTWVVASLAVLSFVAGGFSETAAIGQVALLLGGVVVLRLAVRPATWQRLRPVVIAAFAGTVVALVIVGAAPGNEARIRALPPRPPIAATALRSASYAARFAVRALIRQPLPLVALVAGAAALYHLSNSSKDEAGDPQMPAAVRLARVGIVGGVIGITTIVLIALSLFPSVYGYALRYPPGRVWIVPAFLLSAAAGAVGISIGRMTNIGRGARVPVGLAVGILLVLTSLLSTTQLVVLVPPGEAYAAKWDEQDRQIRRAASNGSAIMTVQALGNTGGLADVNADPTHWVNGCMARYYGLLEIRAQR